MGGGHLAPISGGHLITQHIVTPVSTWAVICAWCATVRLSPCLEAWGFFFYLIVLYLPLCWMWINMAKSRQYRVSYRGQIEAWKPWSQVGTWAGDSDWNHHPRPIVPSWHSVTDPTRWILCKHLLVQPLLLFYSIRPSTCLVSAASATVGIGWPTSKVFL